MEQMRLLIAIVLSFAVFFLWSLFLAPKAPEKTETAVQESTETQSGQSPQKEEKGQESQAAVADQDNVQDADKVTEPPPQLQNELPVRKARRIKVSTPLYTMTLSEKGAVVVSMILDDYRETVDPESPLKELISGELANGTILVDFIDNGNKGIADAVYQADVETESLDVKRQEEIKFHYIGRNGLRIEKTYTFRPDSYLVGLEISAYNAGDTNLNGKLSVTLNDIMGNGKSSYAFEGPCGLINDSLEQVKVKKIEDNNLIDGEIRWLANESRYFMSSIIPNEAVQGQMRLSYNDGKVSNQLVLDHPPLEGKQEERFSFDIFMGPKNLSLLRSYNNELDRAINFGWVDILAKPCLWFMNLIYKFIPNYGVAIIILTILTRMIFWPLATKSYKSMGEMRKLQPLMQEIREKHKNDKQKMNQEMMSLYRTYKINPMGGCLPMLIQLPVFFALYRMLYQAIELRHAPFILWINDLSAPDRLFNFSFKIPFMEPPYGIPVLTLVMAATMFIQQKMTPTPGDPAQAKMMMFLPLIFLFIFINFSSGLVLYWMISNIISIAQQYYIHKKVA